MLSLLTYNSADPSFNSAMSNHSTQNIMGQTGASISDILFQTFGLAGALVGMTFLAWGYNIFKRRSMAYFWSRIVAMFIGTFTGAISLARVPAGDWLPQAYLGGSAGQLLFQNISDNLPSTAFVIAFIAVGLFFGALTVFFIGYAWGVKKHEAKYGASLAYFWASSAVMFIINSAVGFSNWVRHYSDPSYQSKPKAKLLKAKKPKISAKTVEENKTLERVEPTISAPMALTATPPTTSNNIDPDVAANNIKVVAPQAGSAGSMSTGGSQTRFQLADGGEWEYPSVELLQEIPADANDDVMDENALRMNAELLQTVLQDFNIKGEIVSIHPGPVVTLYELEPAAGAKSSRVIGLADDIARSMSAVSVRAAVVPGRNVIGIEIPNQMRQTVFMREMLLSREYDKTQAKLPLILGKDIGGRPIIADLARMPHLLVAGTTGSGKSVAVNTMILSLLYQLSLIHI